MSQHHHTPPLSQPRIYRVGGAVRDQLLGLPVSDRDHVVVGATPQELQEVLLHAAIYCGVPSAAVRRSAWP